MRAGVALLLVAAPTAALLAAGCAVDQAAEVASWRDLVVAGAPPETSRPADAPLGVRETLLLANARNEQLAIAGEAYVRALVDRRRAVAPFLPSLFLAPGYFIVDEKGGPRGGVDVPLVASIDVNPRADLANVERAEAAAAGERARLYDVQDGLLLDVARTLFEVLRAEQSARVLENSLAVQEARVEDARARRDAGFARPLDVSLIEANAADTRVDLLEANRLATTGRALLSFLAGVDLAAAPLDGAIDVPVELPPLDEWIGRAARSRQDVAAADAEVVAAARDVEVASGQWWPSLRIDLERFLTKDSTLTDQDWRALFQVTLPLFSAGRIRADVRDALSRLREAQDARSFAARGARRDVEVAFENLRASRERVERLRVRLASAHEAFEQADSLYDAGLATNLERLVSQDQELASQLALESADLDRRVFWLDLLRSAGALHEWVGLVRPEPAPAGPEKVADAEAR